MSVKKEINYLKEPFENMNILNEMPEYLRDAVTRIIKKEGYVTCNVTKRMLSTRGDNFLGVLYEVDIQGRNKEGSKETYLFVKEPIILKNIRMLSVANIYSSEVYFYNELANILYNLQKNVPVKERYKIPKGYNETSVEAIVLENLARSGYKTFNGMSLKFAELSVRQLAKFHGLFFVIKKTMPEYYEMNIKTKKYPVTFNEEWNVFISNICDKVIEALDKSLQNKVRKLVPKIYCKYQAYFSDNSPICVLCHGDYKAQNIMIKEINGEIVEVLPLDYQMIYHGCPINDFFFFIFSNTDQQFRRDHLEHLKYLYHESLEQFLEYFNMDIETVFPRRQFEQIYKDRLEYGLMTGIYLTYFQFLPKDNLPDLEYIRLSEVVINPTDGFGNWVRGLIDDFVRWGYF